MGQWLAQQAKYIGNAKIKGELYQVSYYPALVQGERWIEGDVFLCPPQVWPVLDEFEGITDSSPEYSRRLMPVWCDDGQYLEAWVYWYLKPTTHLVKII